MRKVYIINTTDPYRVTLAARTEDGRLISRHSCEINFDTLGATLRMLLAVMYDLSISNNIKLVGFDNGFVNMLMRDSRVWRKSKWDVAGADIAHKDLWETWHRMRRYNKIYVEHL